MRLSPALAAVALLTVAAAGPVLAQEPAPAPAEAADPIEAALADEGAEFEARMEQLEAELIAVRDDPALDVAGKTAAADAVLARYTADFEAFAAAFEAVLRAEADKPENADAREGLLLAATEAPAAVRGLPDLIRAEFLAEINPPPPPVVVPAD